MKEKLKNIFNNKKRTISFIAVILCSLSMLLGAYLEYDQTGQVDTNKISEAISTVVDEIIYPPNMLFSLNLVFYD